jgi:putative nucleotidyltransferase with HDIG domain
MQELTASFTRFWRSPATAKLPLAVYILSVCVASVALTIFLVIERSADVGPLWVLLPLALIGASAERARVQLHNHVEGSISLLPTLFAAVALGPLPAVIVGGASMLFELRRPYLKWLTFTASRSLGGGLAGLAAVAASSIGGSKLGAVALATLGGGLTSQALDASFTCVTFRLRGHGRVSEFARALGPLVVTSLLLYAPVVGVLALTYQELSAWSLPVFLVPAVAAHRLFVLYQQQREMSDNLVVANARLERANLSFAIALVATLDARDRYTAGHSAAVAIYARDIAAWVGLNEHEQRLAHLCGLVHDIGKTGLWPGLLEKPGALTLEERRQMQEHSAMGERILLKVEDYAEIADIVRHHHERWDGAGYPDGLAGDEIPLLARIIAVADAYNAMTSDRPYRDAMSSQIARVRLMQGAQHQFDPTVVAAFEAVLATASEAYRCAERPDFSLKPQKAQMPRARELAAATVA